MYRLLGGEDEEDDELVEEHVTKVYPIKEGKKPHFS